MRHQYVVSASLAIVSVLIAASLVASVAYRGIDNLVRVFQDAPFTWVIVTALYFLVYRFAIYLVNEFTFLSRVQTYPAMFVGCDIGLRLGVSLSLSYSAFGLIPGWCSSPQYGPHILVLFLMVVLPSGMLGLLTGSLIGAILGRRHAYKWASFAMAVGVGVALLLAIAINMALRFFWIDKVFGVLMVGLPSIIFVISSGWAGRQISHRLTQNG